MSLKMLFLIAPAVFAAVQAGAAQSVQPTVTATDGSTVLGGVGSATVTLNFAGTFALDGGGFNLSWDPAALELMPAASSVGGMLFSDLPAWVAAADAAVSAMLGGGSDYIKLNDHRDTGLVSLSATMLPASIDVSDSQLVLLLAFKGLQVGSQAVSYEVSAFDLNDSNTGSPIDGALHIGVTAVPEPATWALWLAGGALAGALSRRRSASR